MLRHPTALTILALGAFLAVPGARNASAAPPVPAGNRDHAPVPPAEPAGPAVGWLAPMAVPSAPDKLIRLGANGAPDVGWGTKGIASTMVHPQLVAYDGKGGTYVLDQATVAPGDTRVVVTHLAANGQVDPAFGRGGGYVIGLPGSTLAQAVTLDAKGRVVLLASSTPKGSAPPSLVLYRFVAGALDPSFGTNGLATVSLPKVTVTQASGPVSLGSDAAGRVLVAGSDNAGTNRNVFVVRVLENGTPDPSFGGGGATASRGGHAMTVARVLADPAGRVFVVANKDAPAFTDASEPVASSAGILVFRFTPAGAADAAYGTEGAAVVEDASGGLGALDALLMQGGPATGTGTPMQVVVGGYQAASQSSAAMKPLLLRLNENGKLDSGFGSGGRGLLAAASTPTLIARVRRIARDGTGRILVVGTYREGTTESGAAIAKPITFVTRLNGSSGQTDASYGTRGTTSLSVQTWHPEIDPQGRVLFHAP